MKKFTLLSLLLCLLSSSIFAQFGEVTSVQIIPANPTDNDQIKAVVEVMTGSSPCSLDMSSPMVAGSSILLDNNYCEGMLATICSRTDTIDLGTLAAGSYTIAVSMKLGAGTPCSNYAPIDTSSIVNFTVSVFSSSKLLSNNNSFQLFPSPSNSGLVNIKPANNLNYSIECYNSIGKRVFTASALTGVQQINLPKEQGVYFIKIIDSIGLSRVMKAVYTAP